ncbi:MAG: NAD(P)H-hydrate dehydratase [Dokdonella sp.]
MQTGNPSIALFSVEQVRRLDRMAISDLGVAGAELMRRAATAAFACLQERWPDARSVVVIAGNGNNGGDAFLLASLARQAGMSVTVIALGDRSSGDAATARESWLASGGEVVLATANARIPVADLLVDGLFGTGLSRAPTGPAADLIEQMERFPGPRLALDVPSGLDADRGTAPGIAMHADATISFVGWKRGLFCADGPDYCGAVELATLELPGSLYQRMPADAELLDEHCVEIPGARRRNVNKGNFGHVLVIGGDRSMAGAVRLAGEAALRAGAGLVSVATRAENAVSINAARPEIMVHGVDGPQSIALLLNRASVVALGPGLGQTSWAHALWDGALRAGKPLVLDADGLNLLAAKPQPLPQASVLTPHPGEAARLLGCEVKTIQSDRFSAVRELAARYSAVVVLKGAGSLVADPDGQVSLCPFGNPGMASAGMGDVLTGVLAGLLAQGLGLRDAARIGVVAHALAGDRAAGDCPRGLLASDLFAPLRACLNGASS